MKMLIAALIAASAFGGLFLEAPAPAPAAGPAFALPAEGGSRLMGGGDDDGGDDDDDDEDLAVAGRRGV